MMQVMPDQHRLVMKRIVECGSSTKTIIEVIDDIFKHAATIGNEPENANQYLKQVCQKEVRKIAICQHI
jgi:hypothetical protein